MGRPFRIILLWLLAGLLMTIAIAWIPAVPPLRNLKIGKSSFPRGISTGQTSTGEPHWNFTQSEHITYTSITARPSTSGPVIRGIPMGATVPSWSRMNKPPPPNRKDQVTWRLLEVARGWPMRALFATYINQPRRIGDSHLNIVEGIAVYRIPQPRSTGREYIALPTRPIWPGLMVNSSLYATLLWLLSGGTRRARKGWRIRHGRCPRYSYDLRGVNHERCPECGTPAAAPLFVG